MLLVPIANRMFAFFEDRNDLLKRSPCEESLLLSSFLTKHCRLINSRLFGIIYIYIFALRMCLPTPPEEYTFIIYSSTYYYDIGILECSQASHLCKELIISSINLDGQDSKLWCFTSGILAKLYQLKLANCIRIHPRWSQWCLLCNWDPICGIVR